MSLYEFQLFEVVASVQCSSCVRKLVFHNSSLLNDSDSGIDSISQTPSLSVLVPQLRWQEIRRTQQLGFLGWFWLSLLVRSIVSLSSFTGLSLPFFAVDL